MMPPTKKEIFQAVIDICITVNKDFPTTCPGHYTFDSLNFNDEKFNALIRQIQLRCLKNKKIDESMRTELRKGSLDGMVNFIARIYYPTELEYVDICKILPHGPGIMVDRVTSLEVDMNPPQIRAIYNVSGSAWWAEEHFSNGDAIMPEKLMGEGLSQTAGLLLYFLSKRKKGRIVSVDNGDYSVHKPAFPGDVVKYFVEKLKFKKGLYLFKGTVEVNGYKSFSQTVKLGRS